MPTLPILPVNERSVASDSVVPDDDSALGPLHTRLEVCSKSDVVVEEFQEEIGLFLFESDDVTGDFGKLAWVHMADWNCTHIEG